ncbi:site-specific integrase [Geodermatophilus sp. SYSU D01180]
MLVLPGDLHSVERYVAAAKADNTRLAYADDWRAFTRWASGRGFPTTLPVDPIVIAAWLSSLADAGAAPKTIERRLTGLADAHRSAGHLNPAHSAGVRAVMRGIRREAIRNGHRPRKARALTTSQVRALVEDLPAGLAGTRDRALILTSFALGLRASDTCGLDVGDLSAAGHGGLDVTIRFSKTDQLGDGEVLALAPGVRASTCPVRALQAWTAALAAQGLTEGPLFRAVGKGRGQRLGGTRMSRSSVRLILHRAAAHAGVSQEALSSHSLRRGYATQAYLAGVPEPEIARTGRWKSITVMRGYDASTRWADPASGRLGL